MRRDAIVLLIIAAGLVAWLALRLDEPRRVASTTDSTALLSAAPQAFKRVTGPASLEFPADHGAHPGFRNEWWYFTGNLDGPKGRRLGFQFTLFRFGLAPERRIDMTPERRIDSDFAADAVWMAHVALSDVENRRFLAQERFARGALGLAGATADQWWLRDWTVTRTPSGWRLEARADEFELALALEPLKPIVLNGDAGYNRKGPEPGNASRYYSITRLAADGEIRLDDQLMAVDGLAWLDREWGSSQLGEGLDGWDWFSLQLEDGRDLMLYRLRTTSGNSSRYSAGTLVEPDGRYRVLDAGQFELESVRTWRDADGVDWPVAWRLTVAGEDLSLVVEPKFDRQLWERSVRYWEGAVTVLGSERGDRRGHGYLELSGY